MKPARPRETDRRDLPARFSRRPSPNEIDEGLSAIARFRKEWPARLARDNQEAPREAGAAWLALANYCHALLNSAEFSFID